MEATGETARAAEEKEVVQAVAPVGQPAPYLWEMSSSRIEGGARAAVKAFYRGDRLLRIQRHEQTGEILHVFGFVYPREGDPQWPIRRQ